MSTRRLNIPGLGFEVVVVGASAKTNELIGDLLEKKIAEEIVEEEKLCSQCGFPDLDGLWYDGLCEPCHENIATASVVSALVNLHKESEDDQEPQGCKHCGNVANGCTCEGGL